MRNRALCVLFTLAPALTACEPVVVILPTDDPGMPFDTDKGVDSEDSDEPLDTDTLINPDTADTDEPVDTDSAETDEPVDPCNNPVVHDLYGVEYEVPALLHFELNRNSPQGVVGSGLREVLRIDATALCGDVMLKRTLLQTTTDGDDIGWMEEARHGASAVSYVYRRQATIESYDGEIDHVPYSSVTALYWDHEFGNYILVPEGETFTFSLYVTFGGEVIPPGTFSFNLTNNTSWFGIDDPEAYPQDIDSEWVLGHELSF